MWNSKFQITISRQNSCYVSQPRALTSRTVSVSVSAHTTDLCMFVCLFSWCYNPFRLYFHSPVAGFSLLVFEVSWSHTTTRHIRQDSSERVINPSQRPLPDNTQHSQQTNIHAPGGIRTHNLSRREAEDLCLRPRGHWDRRQIYVLRIILKTNWLFL